MDFNVPNLDMLELFACDENSSDTIEKQKQSSLQVQSTIKNTNGVVFTNSQSCNSSSKNVAHGSQSSVPNYSVIRQFLNSPVMNVRRSHETLTPGCTVIKQSLHNSNMNVTHAGKRTAPRDTVMKRLLNGSRINATKVGETTPVNSMIKKSLNNSKIYAPLADEATPPISSVIKQSRNISSLNETHAIEKTGSEGSTINNRLCGDDDSFMRYVEEPLHLTDQSDNGVNPTYIITNNYNNLRQCRSDKNSVPEFERNKNSLKDLEKTLSQNREAHMNQNNVVNLNNKTNAQKDKLSKFRNYLGLDVRQKLKHKLIRNANFYENRRTYALEENHLQISQNLANLSSSQNWKDDNCHYKIQTFQLEQLSKSKEVNCYLDNPIDIEISDHDYSPLSDEIISEGVGTITDQQTFFHSEINSKDFQNSNYKLSSVKNENSCEDIKPFLVEETRDTSRNMFNLENYQNSNQKQLKDQNCFEDIKLSLFEETQQPLQNQKQLEVQDCCEDIKPSVSQGTSQAIQNRINLEKVQNSCHQYLKDQNYDEDIKPLVFEETTQTQTSQNRINLEMGQNSYHGEDLKDQNYNEDIKPSGLEETNLTLQNRIDLENGQNLKDENCHNQCEHNLLNHFHQSKNADCIDNTIKIETSNEEDYYENSQHCQLEQADLSQDIDCLRNTLKAENLNDDNSRFYNEICSEEFNSFIAKRNTSETKVGNRNVPGIGFNCHVCDEKCLHPCPLKDDDTTHTVENMFQCHVEECGKGFDNYFAFQTHHKLHAATTNGSLRKNVLKSLLSSDKQVLDDMESNKRNKKNLVWDQIEIEGNNKGQNKAISLDIDDKKELKSNHINESGADETESEESDKEDNECMVKFTSSSKDEKFKSLNSKTALDEMESNEEDKEDNELMVSFASNDEKDSNSHHYSEPNWDELMVSFAPIDDKVKPLFNLPIWDEIEPQDSDKEQSVHKTGVDSVDDELKSSRLNEPEWNDVEPEQNGKELTDVQISVAYVDDKEISSPFSDQVQNETENEESDQEQNELNARPNSQDKTNSAFPSDEESGYSASDNEELDSYQEKTVKPFVCSVNGCEKSYTFKFLLDLHLSSHKTDTDYVCSYSDCTKTFKASKDLKLHLLTHSGSLYYCIVAGCKGIFKSRDELKTHKTTAHKKKREFSCDVMGCGQKFMRFCDLIRHFNRHHGNAETRTYVCSIDGCKKRFNSRQSMKIHTNSHYNGKSFVCKFDGCVKKFKRQKDFNYHLAAHKNQKPYGCDIRGCNKRFTLKYELTDHLLSHFQKGPVLCGIDSCGKKLADPFKLRSHMSKHRADNVKGKDFVCPFEGCGKMIGREYFKFHLSNHYKEKCYACQEVGCNKQFKTQYYLNFHVKQVHNTNSRSFACSVDGCDKKFKFKSSLERHTIYGHTTQKQFVCDKCGMKFVTIYNLLRHLDKVHKS